MEKLQAALARAREKRENDGRPVRRTEPLSRAGSRRAAKEQEIADRWDALPMMTTSEVHLKKSRVFAGHATAEAQHFDILRTKLLLEMRQNDWTRIAITSATPGCGKTTTACNLIAGLGRQPELKGMLFDLDLRRPSVAKLLGVEPRYSLVDVLNGSVEYADQAMRLHENTSISMTTTAVSDPAKLVLRSTTMDMIDRIQDQYRPNMMLFDTPPVLVSDETRGFLKHVDAVVIVAAAETTSVAQVDEVEREIAQYTNVAGIVLNKCRFMEDNYGYAY